MSGLADRAFCRALGMECEAALKAIAEKHGLTVAYHGGTLGVGSFTAKLEFSENDREQKEFNEYCRLVGLMPTDYHAVVVVSGKPHRLVGVRPSSYKMPFIFERIEDGARYNVARSVLAKIEAVRPAVVPS